jgi:hypothetical protein
MIREIIRDENGEIIAATCVRQPLTDEERAAIAALVKIARKKFEEDPDREEKAARQAAAMERIRARNARWDEEAGRG